MAIDTPVRDEREVMRANDTVTLAVNTADRDLPAHLFVAGMTHFQEIVYGLTTAYAQRAKIDWVLDEIDSPISPVTTFRAMAQRNEDEELIPVIVQGYLDVGIKLKNNQQVVGTRRVIEHAEKLRALLNGRVKSLRFETAEDDAEVLAPDVPPAIPANYRTGYGAIRGSIQTLSNRRGLRFVLYDAIFDQAISCYLQPGQEEQLRGMWGRRVIVEGLVSRDSVTGRPVAIRDITAIVPVVEAEPGSYKNARGAIPAPEGGELPEDAIRRIRDAS